MWLGCLAVSQVLAAAGWLPLAAQQAFGAQEVSFAFDVEIRFHILSGCWGMLVACHLFIRSAALTVLQLMRLVVRWPAPRIGLVWALSPAMSTGR